MMSLSLSLPGIPSHIVSDISCCIDVFPDKLFEVKKKKKKKKEWRCVILASLTFSLILISGQVKERSVIFDDPSLFFIIPFRKSFIDWWIPSNDAKDSVA